MIPVLRPVPDDMPRPTFRDRLVLKLGYAAEETTLLRWLTNRGQTGTGDWAFDDLESAFGAVDPPDGVITFDAYEVARELDEDKGWPVDFALVLILDGLIKRLPGLLRKATAEWVIISALRVPASVNDTVVFIGTGGVLLTGKVETLDRAVAVAEVRINDAVVFDVPAETVVANHRTGEDALIGKVNTPKKERKILEFVKK